jgi:D-alanyl-D-alanine carboxypeptidase
MKAMAQRASGAAVSGLTNSTEKGARPPAACVLVFAIVMRLFLVVALVVGTSMLAGERTVPSPDPRPQDGPVPSVCSETALRNADSIDRVVIRAMREKHIPGLSLALVRDGRADKLQSYGWADLESCVPATNATRFGIGSISKQFAAAGALLLARNRISLDDSITKYLPEGNGVWDGITIRHLLTHTSGIKDYADDDNKYECMRLDRTSAPPTAELVRQIAAAPLNFLAGEDWAYSNTGYLLLSVLIERVSGQSFADYMHNQVFVPLGMTSTRFYSSSELIPKRGTPYHVAENAAVTHGDYIADQFSRWGDMGMLSTGPDMMRWAAAMDSTKFLTKGEWKEMFTPVRLNDGSAYPYGFGLGLGEVRGRLLVSHGGTFRVGYSAYFLHVPARRVTVVILSNHFGEGFPPKAICHDVIDVMDRVLASFPEPATKPDPNPNRTEALLQLLRGANEETGAISTTAAFRHLVGAGIGGFAKANPNFRGLLFLECRRPSPAPPAAFGTAVNDECSYRLDGVPGSKVMTFWLTRRNELAGYSSW